MEQGMKIASAVFCKVCYALSNQDKAALLLEWSPWHSAKAEQPEEKDTKPEDSIYHGSFIPESAPL